MGQRFDRDDNAASIVGAVAAQLAHPEESFSLMVRFTIREGADARAVAAFAAALPATRAEQGCLAFEPHRHAGDARRFTVYERWRNLAAFESHFGMPYVATLSEALFDIIDGIPEFDVLVPA